MTTRTGRSRSLARRSQGAITWLVLLVLSSSWQACGGSSESEVESPPPAVYAARGVIRQIRQVGDGKTQISILHEAIPDFIGIDGDVVGMKSMTMPFTVANTVHLTGFEPGSRVRFELAVDWHRRDPALITSIETLPDDVLLSFEAPD